MMILVSVMLAVFLGWPLAFGGHGSSGIESGRAEAKPVAAVLAPAEQPQFIRAVAQAAPAMAPAQAESCYKRYQREIRQCSEGGAACRLKSADNWDICEATGFWPN